MREEQLRCQWGAAPSARSSRRWEDSLTGPLEFAQLAVADAPDPVLVAGGNGVGLDTALNMAGIHSPGFEHGGGIQANLATIDQLEAEFGSRPRWLLQQFRWEP